MMQCIFYERHRITTQSWSLEYFNNISFFRYGCLFIPFNDFFNIWGLLKYFYGAIDDLWENSKGEFIVVDYKATSKNEKIETLNKEWQGGYKRQMEMYQWLLRKNDHKVSNTGYFVYCNGITDKEAFDAQLEFDVTLIPYEGDDSWVEKALQDAHKCLNSDKVPQESDGCDYCAYREAVKKHKV